MTLPPLPDRAIVLQAHAVGWREAIGVAGDALVASGATDAGYTDRMIGVIDEFGAYIVIAPGLALAHARPGTDVRSAGLAVVTLADPVNFGHPHNDPVSVVIGLAVTTAEKHLTSIADLANVFNDPSAIPAIAAAGDAAEVRAILGTAG